MPGKVKVKILAGKNLPVMDRSSDTTDAYVEIKLGSTTYKTDVCRKSLNPQWNSDWYRFEVDDSELQDEPLQIRLMDHDTYSANDAIGKVYLALNPLLLSSGNMLSKFGWGGESSSNSEHVTNSALSGWFPVYDTMHGIRGEVNIIVKVELFSDFNKFRQSSCGVQFFCSPVIPHGYSVQTYQGFVEELIVNDDPEYQWIDKIRTPRASNEARQTLFFKLAGELQRKIGVKTLELGGNAVVGYSQCFDLEGELGIVVRGIGTAVTLIKLRDSPPLAFIDSTNEERALSYLQFLRYDSSFHLNREQIINAIRSSQFYNTYSQFHPQYSNESINKSYLDKLSLTNSFKYDSHIKSKSTPCLNCSLTHMEPNTTVLQTKLKQEDLRSSPARGVVQHLRNFKYLSRNLFTRKYYYLKSKMIKLKGKNSKFIKFVGKRNVSNTMATLLVHSIMHTEVHARDNIKCTNKSNLGNNLETIKKNRKSISLKSSICTSSSSSHQDISSDSDSERNTSKCNLYSKNMAPLALPENFDSEQSSTSTNGLIFVKNSNKMTQKYISTPVLPNSNNVSLNSTSNDNNRIDWSRKEFYSKFFKLFNYLPKSSSLDCDIETSTSSTNKPMQSAIISSTFDSTDSLNCCVNSIPHNMSDNLEHDICSNNTLHASLASSLRAMGSPTTEINRTENGHQRTESVGTKLIQSPARFHPIPFMHRRSSDSDLSITPKGNSLTGSDKSYGLPSGYFSRVGAMFRPTLPQDNFDMLEYPFITMTKYPPGCILYLGGVVSARSVKLLERITNLEEPESRDTWWTELRMEIRSHARALNCNAVLAYSESSSICDDVCVLSASGTAAVIGFHYTGEANDNLVGLPAISKQYYTNKDVMATSLDRNDFEKEKTVQKVEHNIGINTKPSNETVDENPPTFNSSVSPCNVCHLPYSGNSVPLRSIILKCAVCKVGKVPEVLLATIEMPEGIPTVGRGCFIQASVCRQLKDLRSESNAKDISDGLPFLEYELHRILVNKIRIKGMNAVFGLKVKISIGAKMLVGIATGTGVFLLSLPPPPLPKLVSCRSVDEKKLAEMQQVLSKTVDTNKEIYQLKMNDDLQNLRVSPDNAHSEDEQPFIDLSNENRDCCILEIDDPEDMEIMNLLMEPRPPDGFHVVNTELVPGLEEMEIVKNLQMFTQIWRSKICPSYNFGKHIHKLLQSVYFKLRRMVPCSLCNLQFRVDLPESDEVQLTVIGMALGLGEIQKTIKHKRKNMRIPVKEATNKNDECLMFNLEEDIIETNSTVQLGSCNLLSTGKHRAKSPHRNILSSKQMNIRERLGIDITPLSFIPKGKIERYLGNLNFFFIRETTSIREEGGLSGFIHSFITEILAIVRAHITALGGNAMVAYYMTECVLSHSLHKNQGQCLINVGGDVVFVSYFLEE